MLHLIVIKTTATPFMSVDILFTDNFSKENDFFNICSINECLQIHCSASPIYDEVYAAFLLIGDRHGEVRADLKASQS